MTKLKNPSGLILFSIFSGWLANVFFYEKWPGISLILFVVIFSIGFWMIAQLENRPITKRNLWLMVPLLFCATMVMVRANGVLTFLNLAVTGTCFILLAIFMTTGKSFNLGLLGIGALPFRAAGSMAIRPWPIVRENARIDFDAVQFSPRDTLYPVLRGAVLAVPVLLVFLGLLISADAVFAQTLASLFDIRLSFGFLKILERGLFIGAGAWCAIGYSAYALRSSDTIPTPLPERVLSNVRNRLPLGTIESLTILALVDLLFGTFVIIQFAYLFGGDQFVNLDGISYAEYARRGFFELVTVAILTLLLIQIMNWFTVKKHTRDIFLFNTFASLIIGFVIVMLVSAFQRLSLYEWTYGFTQLRIFVHATIVWMGIALIWYVITLWKRPDRFAIGALICLFGFVVSLNLINPDAMIVRKNLQRYQTIGHLDLEYLTTLSADAVPELITLAEIIENDSAIHSGKDCSGHNWASLSSSSSRSGILDRGCIEASHPDLLSDHLNDRHIEYQTDPSWSAWQAFHIGHARAQTQLSR